LSFLEKIFFQQEHSAAGIPSREFPAGIHDMSDNRAKNEGEPLHIVSPSTIPLTLGEEMAVLVLPK
jgi:hypothetical protein